MQNAHAIIESTAVTDMHALRDSLVSDAGVTNLNRPESFLNSIAHVYHVAHLTRWHKNYITCV